MSASRLVVPAASVPAGCTVTAPLIIPLPPKAPPAAMTPPLPPIDPFTSSIPLLTVVSPL